MSATGSTFRDPRWLRQHAINLLNFYYPNVIDDRDGGYIAQISDRDGRIYESETKHLVAHCRLVYNFSVGELLGGPDWCRQAAEHGLNFLLDEFRDDERGGYPWILRGREVADGTRSCYGHAFVLLALATAAKADLPRAAAELDATYDLIDEHFWETEHGLCRSEFDADWSDPSEYRGQNANMHTCEAMLAAYEATGEEKYLARATTIAESLALEFSEAGDGLLWEHYTADWEHDWEYNRDQPGHLFRPWGYQPGHLLEWSKLLALLDRHADADWYLDRARRFFEAATTRGWDDERGGFVYNFNRDGDTIVADKYYWPLTEGFGAAALLAERTGDDAYWELYDRIWAYAYDEMVNLKYGNWYFKLTPDNEVHEEIDPTPKVTVGYHPLGGCFEVLRTVA